MHGNYTVACLQDMSAVDTNRFCGNECWTSPKPVSDALGGLRWGFNDCPPKATCISTCQDSLFTPWGEGWWTKKQTYHRHLGQAFENQHLFMQNRQACMCLEQAPQPCRSGVFCRTYWKDKAFMYTNIASVVFP